MNRFEFSRPIDDLGFTVVENAFINHYMPKARGDYVKVYLYGMKTCSCGCGNYSPSNAEIANALKMTESDVINAWKYWDAEGILHYTQNDDDCMIEYLSVSCKLLIPSMEKQPKPKAKSSAPSAKIRQMHKDIEEKYAKPLTVNQLSMFQEWIDEYHFTPQTIVLIVADSIDRNKLSDSYWKKMAQVFFDAGIRTYDQAQQFLKNRDTRWKQYNEITKYLGFNHSPTAPEKAMIDKWFDEYSFDMQTIKAACDETIRTSNPSLKYVDTILTGNKAEASSAPGKKIQRKNKMEYDHNYDIDLIEQALFGEYNQVENEE